MSDLQISLLVAGALVVAGVYLFNVWQERQFRRRAEHAFAREHEDVLLQSAATQEKVAGERLEPKLEVTASSGALAAARLPVKARPEMAIDPVIDYVVEVTLPDAADGAELHAELIALSVGWGKPVLVAAYAAAGGEWQAAGIDGGARDGSANRSFLRRCRHRDRHQCRDARRKSVLRHQDPCACRSGRAQARA